MDMIDELDATDILDVGSGTHGLSWYSPRKVVQTDLVFPADHRESARVGEAEFVAARAEALPFKDDAFDVVISLDLVEHLPEAIRNDALSELCRVARRAVIVGYPDGLPAQRLDRVLAAYWKVRGAARTPPWLAEHLDQSAYPDRSLVENAIPDTWQITADKRSGNVWWQGLIVILEWTPVLSRLTTRYERRLRTRPTAAFLDRGKTYRTIWLVEPRPAPGA
ncbi:class I SAM-dependent methyltransferase [Nocardioides panacis]|uniref:Class I SAM-dependent methyltransferase n=1 Tax=Nocardioides panacis TaxID=2849501 RepID=A0A975Y063_9ACTN|nr:class I SAM-dependent methyltransferase [Nocardioides panacis]QWZ08138.1 class I SAM-dependent methyltransferase [Nocardioides panacis]